MALSLAWVLTPTLRPTLTLTLTMRLTTATAEPPPPTRHLYRGHKTP